MPLIVIQAFPLTNFDDFCTANVFNITEEKKATYKNVTYFNMHIYKGLLHVIIHKDIYYLDKVM